MFASFVLEFKISVLRVFNRAEMIGGRIVAVIISSIHRIQIIILADTIGKIAATDTAIGATRAAGATLFRTLRMVVAAVGPRGTTLAETLDAVLLEGDGGAGVGRHFAAVE